MNKNKYDLSSEVRNGDFKTHIEQFEQLDLNIDSIIEEETLNECERLLIKYRRMIKDVKERERKEREREEREERRREKEERERKIRKNPDLREVGIRVCDNCHLNCYGCGHRIRNETFYNKAYRVHKKCQTQKCYLCGRYANEKHEVAFCWRCGPKYDRKHCIQCKWSFDQPFK